MKERRLIERARVDRVLAVCADDPAEYKPSARRAVIAYRVPATYGLRDGVFRLTTETHGAGWKGEKRNETRPRSLPAIPAEAIALVQGIAPRFIANRPTKATAGINVRVGHVSRLPRYRRDSHRSAFAVGGSAASASQLLAAAVSALPKAVAGEWRQLVAKQLMTLVGVTVADRPTAEMSKVHSCKQAIIRPLQCARIVCSNSRRRSFQLSYRWHLLKSYRGRPKRRS